MMREKITDSQVVSTLLSFGVKTVSNRAMFNRAALAVLALGVVGCRCASEKSTRVQTSNTNYPAVWFAPVAKEGAPVWEILPQEAGPGEVILSKRNELGLLSNFAATPFVFRGKRYASLEGFWQMMKYPESDDEPRSRFPGVHWAYTRQQVAQM